MQNNIINLNTLNKLQVQYSKLN